MTPKTLQQIHSNLSTLRGDNPAFVGGNTLKGRAAVGRGGGVGRWWSAATLAGLLALIGQFIAPSASAQTIYYWDCNTNTAGFGAAQGTWSATTAPGATQGWSTSAAGNIGLGSVLTALTDTSENFGNSSNGLTAGAVTISGAVSAGTNLVFGAASGAITLAGGTSITLPATATISVNNTKDIISTPLAGAASLLTLSAGNLVISNTALPASTYNIANGAILELTATTVNPLSAGVTFTNSGTLKLDGGSNGVINFSASATVNMQLAAGGLVQVSSNTTVTGSSGYHGIWSANHSSLTVDSGSVLNFVETGSNTAGAAAQFDGLNGGGVISMGYLTYRTLSLGNNNGNGAYSGAINDANTGNGSTTAVVKNGTGTQILSGNSGFTAGTTINNGILEADSNTALGGGLVTLNGGTLSNNVSATLGNAVNVSTASTIGVGSGQTFTLSGVFTNSGTLAKNGLGVLSLAGANAYTGLINVNAGELRVTTAGSGAATVTVAAGATNGVLLSAFGGQWVSTGSLTNQNSSVFHVNYSNFPPSTNIPPVKLANLSLGTSLTLRVDSFPALFNVGQSYPLITWTVSGPANASGFGTLVLPAGVSGNLSVSGSTLFLNVTGNTGQMAWNAGNGAWDTVTTNWVNGSGSAATYVDTSDGVVFGDAGGVTGNPVITLSTAVAPLGVLMKSASHNYFIGGSAAIGGSSGLILDPANTMTLTLSNVNTFTGGTTIGGGTLAIGGAGSLGSGSYAAPITDNGALNLSSSASQTLSGSIQGTGALSQAGSGSLTLSGANTYSGGTTISNSATIYPTFANGSAFGTGPITISSGGQIYDTSGPGYSAVSTTNAITLNGGTLHIGGGGSKQWALSGPITTTVTTPTTNTVYADGGTGYNSSGNSYSAAIFVNGPLNLGNTTNTLVCYGGNYGISIGGSISGSNGTIIDTSVQLYLGAASNPFLGTIRSGAAGATVEFNAANQVNYMTVDMNAADSGAFSFANPCTIGGLMGVRNLSYGSSALSIGTNSTTTTYSGALAGTGNLTKLGTGTLNFTGTNTYTGETIFNNGILNVASLATYAAEAAGGSPLGGRTSAQDTTSTIGLHFTGGTLQYTNTGLGAQTTDRYIRVLGGVGITATIDASGQTAADTITFSQSGAPINFWDAAGARGVMLTGSNTGNNTFALNIPDYNNGSSPTSLYKNGPGTWDVTNPNNSAAGTTANNTYGGYTGGTILLGGTLGFATNALGASGTILFSNSATLRWDGGNSQDLSARLKIADGITATVDPGTNNLTFGTALAVASAKTGGLTKLSSGSLTLSGVNTYTGGTTIGAGSLTIAGAGSLGAGSYAAAIINNGTLNYNSSASQTLSGIISGTGALNYLGTGTLYLNGTNTYAGPTTVSGGTVTPGYGYVFGTNTVTINSGGVVYPVASMTVSNALILNGGKVELGGGNSHQLSLNGPISVTATNCFISADGNTGYNVSGPGGGDWGAAIFVNGSVNMGSATNLLACYAGNYGVVINGVISGTNGTIEDTSQELWLAAPTNTFTGTLRSTASTATVILGYSGANSVHYMTLDLNTNDAGSFYFKNYPCTIGGLTGGRNLAVSGTLNVGINNSSTAYSGALTGSGSVTLVGTGTLTLSGTNSYTGNTVINAGTLALGASGTLPATTSVNLNGGTLAMGAFNNTVGGIRLAGVTKARGTWGAAGSGANHISSAITGTGILTVTNGGISTSVVTSSANPITYGASVTLTNTVTGSGGDGSAPGGTVTFYDGTNSIGTGTLVSSNSTVSVYTLTVSSFTATTHSITANYSGNASYDLSTSGAFLQGVDPAVSSATVTVNNSPTTFDGTAQAATVTLSGTNTPGTVTVVRTGGAATQTDAGTYPVTATFVPADTNYATLTGLSAGNFIINQAPSVTTTIGAGPFTYNGTAQTGGSGTVTGAGGLSTTPTSFTYSGDQVDVGTYYVTAHYAGDANHTASDGAAVAVTINQATATAFSGLSSLTNSYGVTNLILTGIVSAGGSAYPTNGETVSASINGFTVNGSVTNGTGGFFIDYNDPSLATNAVAGSPYRVTYNYGGDANLAAASADTGTTLTITNALLTVTANNDSKTYDGMGYATNAGATITGFVNGDTAAVLGGTLTYGGTSQGATNAGIYTIVPSGLASTNYGFVYNNGTLTVHALGVTVTADSQTKVYGSADPGLTYSFAPALVAGDSFGGSLTRAAGENVGSYGISLGTLGISSNYSLSYTGANLTITASNLVITANSASKTYGSTVSFAGTEFTTSAMVSGDSVSGVVLASTGATNTAGAGSYSITVGSATGTGLGNYNISYVNGTLSVNPALLGITANSTNMVYGSTNPVFTVSYTGFVNSDSLGSSDVVGAPVLTCGATTNSPVGAYGITNSLGTLASTNYAFALTNGTLTIMQAGLTVTADNQGMTYGGPVPALTASYSGFVNGDTTAVLSGAPGLSTAATTNSPPGSYVITNSLGTLTATNYAITLVNGTLTVSPANLTITANSMGKTYGDALSFAGTEYGSTGLVNGDSISNVTLVAAGGTNATDAVGGYTITPSNATGSGLANYTIAYVNGTLTVNPLGIAVTADAQGKLYGTADPALTYTYAPSLVGGDSFSGSLSRVAGENVGNHAITQGTLELSTNYSLSYTGANLTITASNLVITANSTSKTYGSTVSFAGTEFTTSAMVGGDSVSGVTLTSAGVTNTAGTGSYTIIPSAAAGTGLGNYNITYANGTLTVNPLGVTVRANAQTKVYGTADPALTYTSIPTLVGGDSFTGSLSRAAGANVGSYAITQGSLGLSTNYSLTYQGTNLTITPASLTVAANNQSKHYGQTVTFAGTEFTSGTLVAGDSVTGATLASSGATNSAAVGSYPITISGATGIGLGNYTITYTNGTLTVNAATPVTVNAPVVLGDGTVQLTFTGGDAGVSYRIVGTLDLTSTNWTTLTTVLAGTNSLPPYIDTDATNHPARFYQTVTP